MIPYVAELSMMHGAPQHQAQGVLGLQDAASKVLGMYAFDSGPYVDTNAPLFIASHIDLPPSIFPNTQLAPLVPAGKILNVDGNPGNLSPALVHPGGEGGAGGTGGVGDVHVSASA